MATIRAARLAARRLACLPAGQLRSTAPTADDAAAADHRHLLARHLQADEELVEHQPGGVVAVSPGRGPQPGGDLAERLGGLGAEHEYGPLSIDYNLGFSRNPVVHRTSFEAVPLGDEIGCVLNHLVALLG